LSSDPASAPDVAEIIRIVDDEIDVDAIMAEIRANLARRPKLEPDPSGFTYTHAEGVESELQWAVDEARAAAGDLAIDDQLPRTGIVARFKRPLHQLARFYVELFAERQDGVNRPLVRAVELLAAENARLSAEIAALRQENPPAAG
jgi:hypothetical protein